MREDDGPEGPIGELELFAKALRAARKGLHSVLAQCVRDGADINQQCQVRVILAPTVFCLRLESCVFLMSYSISAPCPTCPRRQAERH